MACSCLHTCLPERRKGLFWSVVVFKHFFLWFPWFSWFLGILELIASKRGLLSNVHLRGSRVSWRSDHTKLPRWFPNFSQNGLLCGGYPHRDSGILSCLLLEDATQIPLLTISSCSGPFRGRNVQYYTHPPRGKYLLCPPLAFLGSASERQRFCTLFEGSMTEKTWPEVVVLLSTLRLTFPNVKHVFEIESIMVNEIVT